MAKTESITGAGLLELIVAEDITLFCDRSLRPYIQVKNDPFQRAWPVRSEWVDSWIAHTCHQKTKLTPAAAVIGQVVNVLAGEAWTIKNAGDMSARGLRERACHRGGRDPNGETF